MIKEQVVFLPTNLWWFSSFHVSTSTTWGCRGRTVPWFHRWVVDVRTGLASREFYVLPAVPAIKLLLVCNKRCHYSPRPHDPLIAL
jgi:hypothetical protein